VGSNVSGKINPGIKVTTELEGTGDSGTSGIAGPLLIVGETVVGIELIVGECDGN